MATGGSPFEEGIDDRDLASWSHESLDDRLNNTVLLLFLMYIHMKWGLCTKVLLLEMNYKVYTITKCNN